MTSALPQDIDSYIDERLDHTADLASEITRWAGHIHAANYYFLKLIARFDRSGEWQGTGIRSCAHWLEWKCGLTIGAAREKVRVARSLELLPEISAAFADGKISYSMVRAMTRAASPATESLYLQIAEYGTASHVERLVRLQRRAQKLQSKDHEQIQQEERKVTCYIDDDGMWVVKARLPAVEGEQLLKALDAIMAVEQEELDAASIAEETQPTTTFGQKRADALSAMAEHYLASAEGGIKTLKGTERTQVMLHVDINTLQRNTIHTNCCLEKDNWLHPDTAKRLSCDASLVTVLEDEQGKVPNIGRRSRIVPPHIKRALDIRDQGCRYPGCSCARYVDSHHIRHWADGGETSLENLVTLCRFHHRALHHGEFSVEYVGGDEEFHFIDRFGNSIAPPVRQQLTDGGQQKVSAETFCSNIDQFQELQPEITPATTHSQWNGEDMDYDIALQVAMDREDRCSEGLSGG